MPFGRTAACHSRSRPRLAGAWRRRDLGQHDQIEIHRVVREASINVPKETAHSILLVHGDAIGFRYAFGDLPTVLAQNDIDLWGMSMRSTLVPKDTTDLAFMKDWGLAMHVEDVRLVMAIARHLRHRQGRNWGKMHLLGYSTGGWIGYACAQCRGALADSDRQVKGIPVDTYIKIDDAEIRQYWCNSATAIEAKRAQGIYHSDNSLFVNSATLSINDPNGPSSSYVGLTNREFALAVAGYVRWFPRKRARTFYHWMAATWTPDIIVEQHP